MCEFAFIYTDLDDQMKYILRKYEVDSTQLGRKRINLHFVFWYHAVVHDSSSPLISLLVLILS